MAKTPEQRFINPFTINVVRTADYVRGSTPPDDIIRTAIKQIKSPNPKQIRIVEGMGYEVFYPDEISELPPTEKEEATRVITEALSDADAVYIEEPPAQS